MSPIANYTTEVKVENTVSEIQKLLIKNGARQILTGYDKKGMVESLSFIIDTEDGAIPFRLPARVEGVEKVLINMRARVPEPWHRNYEEVMGRIHEQAQRVAWRCVKDWIRAQLAFIEAGMATIDEAFLPYMLIGENKTIYKELKEKHFLYPQLEVGKG